MITRLIPETVWRKAFQGPDGRYDGQKFENLAMHLLQKLHGDGWRATKISHDGSRDYEKEDATGRLWAECKAYTEKLSLYVLSPTLIMALLDHPHTIIIVSRSSLNRNAVRHLAAYQASFEKTIISYDGAALDHAIHAAGLYLKYFPDHPLGTTKTGIILHWGLTVDALSAPTAIDFRGGGHKGQTQRPVSVARFGFVRIDFSIKNLNPVKPVLVRIEIQAESLHPSIRMLALGGMKQARSISFTIPAGGVVAKDAILQPTEAQNLVPLPKFNIFGSESSFSVSPGYLSVAHLYQIPLIGAGHRDSLRQSERFLSDRRRGVVIAIEGASGTGKSRLLREIAALGMENGFHCSLYDPEFGDPQAADRIVRGLLAEMSDLRITADDFEDYQVDGDPSPPAANLIMRVLYDKSYPFWDHLQELAESIIERMAKRRRLIIIDNVQFAGDKFVDFVSALISVLGVDQSARIALVLCFNTEFDRPNTKSNGLLERIRAWSVDSFRSEWTLHCKLEDLSTDDVGAFVTSALSGSAEDSHRINLYKQTICSLMQRVQPRPLNLWQSLMYLADEGALTIEQGRLLVRGSETLSSRLQCLPSRLEDLLALRWSRIKERSGIPEEELEGTLRAAYLLGTDSRARLLALDGSERATKYLLHAGLLAAESGERIRFFHYQLLAFARTLFTEFDREVAAKLKKKFEVLSLSTSKFQQYFILSHYSDEVSGQLLAATVQHMSRRGIAEEYWRQYIDILMSHLTYSGRRVGSVTLKGMTLIGEWEQRLASLDRGTAILLNFLSDCLLREQRQRFRGEDLQEFYKCTINACLSIYDDSRALEVVDLALHDIALARFRSSQDREIAEAVVLNRRVATLKGFGRVEEALDNGYRSLQVFRKYECRSMEVETLFDLGSILIKLRQCRNEGWSVLAEGCRTFQRYPDQMAEPAPCRFFYVSGQIALRNALFDEVFQACAQGILHCRRRGNHFWGVRLLTLEIAAHLLRQEEGVVSIAEQLLIEAQDWANVSHAERSRWGLNYLEGKLRAVSGEVAQAAYLFEECLIDLTRHLRTPEQVAWRAVFLVDIASTCRRYGIPIDIAALNSLSSPPMRAEFNAILKMNHSRFGSFEKSRAADAIFSHQGIVVELP